MVAVVVVVSENENEGKAIGRMLRQVEYGVVPATGAAEARQLLELDAPDLIVIDGPMPNNNHIRLILSARRQWRTWHVPILLLVPPDAPDANKNNQGSQIVVLSKAAIEETLPGTAAQLIGTLRWPYVAVFPGKTRWDTEALSQHYQMNFRQNDRIILQRDMSASVDLIVIDHTVTRNGYRGLRILREKHPTTPILFTMPQRTPDPTREALSAGATDVLFHPYDDAALMRTVRRLLGPSLRNASRESGK